MQNNFLIYNASAGSGKTYTLTKAYLELILAPKASFAFSHILALTFTNKAVNEMKERILVSLMDFSTQPLPEKSESIFKEVSISLGLKPIALQKKAAFVLQQLLHNYAFFEVSTIDKFNHRLIRTFAKDLKLPQNFEVQLDTELILNQAVDQLLDRVGIDPILTEILVAFAIEKIADDKSWDLSFDLKVIGKLLFNDLNNEPLELLKDKKLEDFKALKNKLKKIIKETKEGLILEGNSMKNLWERHELIPTDFSGSFLPKFIDKIILGQSPPTSAQWLQDFEHRDPYTKTKPESTKQAINSIKEALGNGLKNILGLLKEKAFHENAYKNLLPLNLINALQFQVKTLCEKRDYLPISAFNKLIKEALSQQSVPFIYERVGEQYRHFFIDEFQDTSFLQWHNLKPLVENALVSEDPYGKPGTLLLVGDAKQAIYRWRGGSATQFIALYENPNEAFYSTPSKTVQLPKNYRSLVEIVNFNNSFFKYTSKYLENPHFSNLFLNKSSQEAQHKEGGFVSIRFLNEDKDQKKEAYCLEVLTAIRKAKENGFQLGDIFVLTRQNKEGALLASYLMEQDIEVISSESLLLENNTKIAFLVGLIEYYNTPADSYLAYPLLHYLGAQQDLLSLHEFIDNNLNNTADFFLRTYGFNAKKHPPQELYDFCVKAIDCFNLWEGKDAYLLYFLDVILEVSQERGGGATIFLSYWNEKKSKLSVKAPEGINAVQILSIHKSKGLEFPVVIYPFVETPIYDEKQAKIWLPVSTDNYCGFEYLYLNKNEALAAYKPLSNQLIAAENEQLALDAFNLLYVAFTRAEKALFVIGALAITSKGEVNTKQYSGVLIDYLIQENKWNENQLEYTFGVFNKKDTPSNIKEPIPIPYLLNKKDPFPLLLHPDTQKTTAITKAQTHGQQLHLLLDKLAYMPLEEALEKILITYPMAPLEKLTAAADAILTHPLLAVYYKEGVVAANEKEIFGADAMSYRPDRLVFENKNVHILDYKTGNEKQEDYNQINHYSSLLSAMGYRVKNKILIYISDIQIAPIFVP